jgi:hypothetical protein
MKNNKILNERDLNIKLFNFVYYDKDEIITSMIAKKFNCKNEEVSHSLVSRKDGRFEINLSMTSDIEKLSQVIEEIPSMLVEYEKKKSESLCTEDGKGVQISIIEDPLLYINEESNVKDNVCASVSILFFFFIYLRSFFYPYTAGDVMIKPIVGISLSDDRDYRKNYILKSRRITRKRMMKSDDIISYNKDKKIINGASKFAFFIYLCYKFINSILFVKHFVTIWINRGILEAMVKIIPIYFSGNFAGDGIIKLFLLFIDIYANVFIFEKKMGILSENAIIKTMFMLVLNVFHLNLLGVFTLIKFF